MKRIPVGPLRAFDVAARNLNLTAAAEEMNVTHAAVSRQVKQLEERLGVKLFERLPRGLKLTVHGALLAEGTREAFDRLATAIEDVSAPAVRRKLTISTFSSLATRWLMPRVLAFSELFPDTDLRVSTSARLVDFAREDVDIALRFGGGQYPGLHVRPMFKPKEIVVAAPSLLKKLPIKTFADLKAHTLLHDDSHQSWTRWLEAVDAKGVNPRRGIICGDRNSMLAATAAGRRHHFGSVRGGRPRSGTPGEGVRYRSERDVRHLCRVPAAPAERSADLGRDGLAGARSAVLARRLAARAVIIS
jgi:LysR family glycine cleavage system transcriptional activator